jgi:hypothetical protein
LGIQKSVIHPHNCIVVAVTTTIAVAAADVTASTIPLLPPAILAAVLVRSGVLLAALDELQARGFICS